MHGATIKKTDMNLNVKQLAGISAPDRESCNKNTAHFTIVCDMQDV